jgi:hypothetical protein
VLRRCRAPHASAVAVEAGVRPEIAWDLLTINSCTQVYDSVRGSFTRFDAGWWRGLDRHSGTTRIPNAIAAAASNGASSIGTIIDSVLALCSTSSCSKPARMKP